MQRDTASDSASVRETIGSVIGRIPSGVFILTASDGNGRETGMLASWVQQASFDPPMISVAVNRTRYLNDWLQIQTRVAVSLLGESDGKLLKHFARGFAPDEPAFEGIDVVRGETGLPALADALGFVEGQIAGQIEAGDHVVYLVEILAAGAGERITKELPRVHIRKNGFSY